MTNLNAWTVDHDYEACWYADLKPARSEPELLLAWQRAILEAGEQFEVFRVVEAPLVDYERDFHGPFPTYLDARCRRTGTLDLFAFAESGMLDIHGRRLRIQGRVARFLHNGAAREVVTDDLGALLATLRPDDAERWASVMRHTTAVEILGRLHKPQTFAQVANAHWLDFSIGVLSDIWMPWVFGVIDLHNLTPPRDNRPLARVHTPRLNAFLGAVRQATESCGGAWRVYEDLTPITPYRPIYDGGIDLDAPPPPPPPPTAGSRVSRRRAERASPT